MSNATLKLQNHNEPQISITREIYEGFQRAEFKRWDAIVATDVLLNSPSGYGTVGLEPLKQWAAEFLKALQPRIDLVDEYEGKERAFVTVNLNWKHVGEFFGLKPTGREGTSIETFILTIKDGKITRWDVADNTLDLALYLWERGWNHPHNIRPNPIITGIERR